MSTLDEEINKETDRLLLKLIDNAAKEAVEEIEKRGTLSMEHAIPLLLKSQYNHILHLDKELVLLRQIMDERFGKMDERFSKIDERFGRVEEKIGSLSIEISQIYKWVFGCFIGTVTILGSLMTLFEFFGK